MKLLLCLKLSRQANREITSPDKYGSVIQLKSPMQTALAKINDYLQVLAAFSKTVTNAEEIIEDCLRVKALMLRSIIFTEEQSGELILYQT